MDIIELAEKYGLGLTKQGSLFVTFCPFHRDENRPNFTIYPETNSYFCYTCSIGGNAIDFFARMEKITYAEAEYRIFNDLQLLRDKINKIAKEPVYNDVTNLQISKKVRDFLYSNPDRYVEVIDILKAVDSALVRELDQEKAVTLVADINMRLNNILKV